MKLSHQPGYTFVPLTEPAQWRELMAFGDRPEFFNVALNVGKPLDEALLTSLLAEKDIYVWRMEPDDSRHAPAYATLSRYALAEQGYVFCPSGWDNTAAAAGLEALSQAVFIAQPECQDMWVCLPVPEPEDAEETLLIMGFTYTPASLDLGQRRTFGLSRDIFMAYHEA